MHDRADLILVLAVKDVGSIVGAAKLGACFGAFLGGALMLHYGRRIAITIDSLLFMLGPIIMASSTGVT